MSSIPWNVVEKAIVAWVRAGSGLAAGRVIWAAQNGPAPSNPYVALRMRVLRPMGSDWVDVEDNPSPSAGAEIVHKVRGVRRATLGITVFADGPVGAPSAVAILSDVIAALALPSVGDALSEAGVGVANIADVLAVDGVVGSTVLEPRATADVTMYLASEVSETGTWIERVEVDRTSESQSFDPDSFDDDVFDAGIVESYDIP